MNIYYIYYNDYCIGFETFLLRHIAASIISLAATFFKSHRSLILLQLLSNPNPLRWASV